MAGDIKLSEIILRSFVEGKVDELSEKCSAEADECGGQTITQQQEEIVGYVIHDGKITDGERAMLGFLPSEVVSGIAGSDGMKPARMKAEAILKRLGKVKNEDIPEIVGALRALDPSTRASVKPAVEKILNRLLVKQATDKCMVERRVGELAKQREALESRLETYSNRYDEMKSAGYRRINNTGISTDGAVYESMIAAHERKMVAYHAANIQPLIERRDKIEEEISRLCCSGNPELDNAVASLVAYVRDVENGSEPSAPEVTPTVLDAMSVDQLAELAGKQHNGDALVEMIDRFPGHAKTTELCYDAIRAFKGAKNNESQLANPVFAKVLGHVSRTRARLAPIVDEVSPELLPAFLAANPMENVSGMLIERIVAASGESFPDGKVDALASAFNGRADKQTLLDATEAIVTLSERKMHYADEILGKALFSRKDISLGTKAWVFYQLNARHHADENWPRNYYYDWGLPYEAYRMATAATDRSERRMRSYESQVEKIGEYATCLAGEYDYKDRGEEYTLDPDACDAEYVIRAGYNAGKALSEKHKSQIRAAMESGATQLYFTPGDEIDVDFGSGSYLDGEIVGVKEK